MILSPLFCFKDTKNTRLLTFNSLKQKKLIFNFVVNRNWKKLTDSRKRAKILADNRKSYHPIETLRQCDPDSSFLLNVSNTTVTTVERLGTRSPNHRPSNRSHGVEHRAFTI